MRVLRRDDLLLVPSVFVKYLSPAPTSVDINTKVKFRGVLWAGALRRASNAFVGMAGVHFSSYGSLSYSYYARTSQLAAYQSSSHEGLLGLKLEKKSKEVGPDRF